MAKMGEFVSLGASNDELKAKLRETTTLMVGSAAEWQKSLDGVGDHGRSAFSKLEEGMKSFKREQVQQGKLVGFYMREIQEFIPLGGEAKSMVAGLGQVLVEGAAGGVGWGLAFEAVKLAMIGIRMAAEAAKGEVGQLREEMDKLLQKKRIMQGDDIEQAYRGKLIPALDEMNRKREAAERMIAKYEENRRLDPTAENILNQNEAIELQRQHIRDLLTDYQRLKVALEKVRDDSRRKAGLIDLGKNSGFESESAGVPAAASSTGKSSGEAFAKAFKKRADELFDGGYLPVQVDRERMTSAADQHGSFLAREKQLKGSSSMPYMSFGKQSDESRAAVDAENLRITEEEIKKQERLRESLQQTAQTWMAYGEQVGSVLGAMATGTASWGDLFKEVLKQVMTALYQYAVSAIMKQAGVAAANTMEENSKAGPWGWVVGLGAMGAVFAAVMGLVGKIGTAEQGTELPSFSGTRMYGLHAEELVLPRYWKGGLKSLIDSQAQAKSGPQRVVNNHFSINANDARSFEEQIHRGGWDRVLNRWAEAQAAR